MVSIREYKVAVDLRVKPITHLVEMNRSCINVKVNGMETIPMQFAMGVLTKDWEMYHSV